MGRITAIGAKEERMSACDREGSWGRTVGGAIAAAIGAGLGAYGALAGLAWYRYGRVPRPHDDERDELLDRFIPACDIVERHHIVCDAPPDVVLAAAREQDLLGLPLVSAIFRAREIVLRSAPDGRVPPRGLLAATLSLGWGVLAEIEDREIVVGAVTKPWEANVIFRALPPGEFAAFNDPEFVKIVWTLRADPLHGGRSMFRTETRAVATDAAARARFRRYWSFASPGIGLIRLLSLRPLKREAERRAGGANVAGQGSAGTADQQRPSAADEREVSHAGG
jgi:hypothetical protein